MGKISCAQFTMKVLRFHGLFPAEGRELNPGFFFYLKFTLLTSCGGLTLIGSVLHLIKTIKVDTYHGWDTDLSFPLTLSASIFFSTHFLWKIKSVSELYLFFSDTEKFGKLINFDEDNAYYNKCSKVHYVYLETLLSGTMAFCTYLHSRCDKIDNNVDFPEVCGILTYAWMPFSINYFPVKQIVLIVQWLGIHHLYMTGGMFAWLVLETVQYIRIRVRHVNYLFIKAVEEKDPKKCRKKFNYAARYHSHLFRLEDKVNQALGIFIFTHIALTAPIIATGMFAILSGKSTISFLICFGWFGGLTNTSLPGQWLQDECFKVGTDLYQADFNHCPLDIKKDIMVVIYRTRRPMCLQTISIGILDYRMFVGDQACRYEEQLMTVRQHRLK